jgi:hypothetical protein
MNRRDVSKTLFLFTLGSGLLISCSDPFKAVKNLGLTQINFKNNDLRLVDEISRIILPIQNIEVLKDHTLLPFVMKSINDLYNEKKRELIQTVYTNWDEYFTQLTDRTWIKASEKEKFEFIESIKHFENKSIEEVQSTKDKLAYFFNAIKSENELYLSTCEFILRNKRAYEMAPGRYNGSYPLSKLQE